MKHSSFFRAGLLLAGLCLACGMSADGETQGAAGEKTSGLVIVTSTPVLQNLAEIIAPENAQVICLLPEGDPHHGEPKPHAVRHLTGADIFLTLPHGAEPWVQSYLPRLPKNADVIMPESLISLPPSPYEGHRDDHFWMHPESLQDYIGLLAVRLHGSTEEALKYSAKVQANLHQAHDSARQRRVEMDFGDKGVLLIHPSAFGLLHALEIPVVQVLQPPGELADPSLKDLKQAGDHAEAGRIMVIIEDVFESHGEAGTVARNLNLPVVQIRSQPDPGEDLVQWWSEQARTLLDFLEEHHG